MNTVSDLPGTKKDSPKLKQKVSLGIRGQLMAGFSAIAMIFIFSMAISYNAISTAKKFANSVINTDLVTYDYMLDINSGVYVSQISLQKALFTSDNQAKAQVVSAWDNIEKAESQIDELAKSWTSNDAIALWPEVKLLLSQLKSSQNKIIGAMGGLNKTAALSLYNVETIPLFTKTYNLLIPIVDLPNQRTPLLDLQLEILQKGTAGILNNLNSIQTTTSGLSILGVLASILIAVITARTVIKHINIFRQYSKRIASGDLTRSIKIKRFDELGQLGNDLNMMTISLAEIAREITQSCQNMVSTIAEVRHSVNTQSSGASQQASSINEITTSLSEIEKSSEQTMSKAISLGDSAERTREKGQQGLLAVEQSVDGMKTIREKVQMIAQVILDLSNQTQQVGEITAAVNSLAQQSKMLALNASIEAAKAGEAGKGFAVVAVEVKNLAEQSEQATSQVQKILENIRHSAERAVMVTEEGTKGVDHGMTLVEQTGDSIRSLNDVIHETTIASQQIEFAVRQEGAGIEQITAGMNEINQVTSTFVESVKQTTEAIDNLSSIAANLKTYVDTYKL